MLKVYASKRAAIRFAKNTYGEQWQEKARYLEVALPDDEMLYCIQQRGGEPLPSRASGNGIARHSAASRAIKASDGIIRKCQAIFNLLGDQQPRKALIEECVRQGAAASTAATQYQRWKKAKASGGAQ